MWYAVEMRAPDETPARWHVVALLRSPQTAAEVAGWFRSKREWECRTRRFSGTVDERRHLDDAGQ